MLKLEYYVQNLRWGENHLIFNTWEEYWKTLGYLSNPNVHRYYEQNADIKIVYENNHRTNSYSGAYRIEYFGDKNIFKQEFPSLGSVAIPKDDMYRINRNEFGDTLVQDLNFRKIGGGGKNTDIVLPPEDIESVLNRLRSHTHFNENAWDEGYSLGNL